MAGSRHRLQAITIQQLALRDSLWETAFQNSLLIPGNSEQDAAGYPPTLTDPWGQLLSYQLLYGPDGGVSDTLS
jgi:lysophospholipase